MTELTSLFAGSAGVQWSVAGTFKYTLALANRFPRGIVVFSRIHNC